MYKLATFPSTALVWLGFLVAPRKLRFVIRCYLKMVENFGEQLDMGRRYGVCLAPWSFSDGLEAERARAMVSAAVAAMTKKRLEFLNEDEDQFSKDFATFKSQLDV